MILMSIIFHKMTQVSQEVKVFLTTFFFGGREEIKNNYIPDFKIQGKQAVNFGNCEEKSMPCQLSMEVRGTADKEPRARGKKLSQREGYPKC